MKSQVTPVDHICMGLAAFSGLVMSIAAGAWSSGVLFGVIIWAFCATISLFTIPIIVICAIPLIVIVGFFLAIIENKKTTHTPTQS